VKTFVPMGELIMALDSDSESGVSLLAVMDLVSLVEFFFFFFDYVLIFTG